MKTARLLVIFAVTVVSCISCWAQNAQITGLVTDSTGASIPGAQVQMTQTGTGLVRTAETNGAGSYTMPELPTGSYQLQVKKAGFDTYVQSGIVLEIDSNPTLNVALQVGAVTQEVTATADATLVETHSSSLGQVVNQQEVLDIPLNARDPMQLLTLTPAAVVQTGFSVQYTFPNPYTIAFEGTSPGDATYLLDGGNDNDYITNGAFPLPFPDALQEFKADTSAVPAQYGMHSSATVNAITKSGTNEFHGDAFEFVRNGDFDARQYYAPVRDPLKRNQYGGVIGGPIRKGKLFFFGAVQNTTVRDQSNSLAFLPTNAEKAGDFTNAVSAACNNGTAVKLKGPFTGGATTISPTLFATPAENLANVLPTPTDQVCGSYPYTTKVDTNDLEVIGKVDYHVNDKHSLFARYYDANYILPQDSATLITLNALAQHSGYQTVTVGDTYLLSATIVNSFHADVNRGNNRKGELGWPTATQLGVQGVYSPLVGSLSVTVGTGVFNVGAGGDVPVEFTPTDYNVADDVEITRGAHQLAFGATFVHFNYDEIAQPMINPEFTFSGVTSGLPIADFLLGDMSAFNQGSPVGQHPRKKYIGIYAQDSLQINRKLTLNYGLRWEPYLAPAEEDGEGDYFSLANFVAGVHSKVYPQAPAGELYPNVRNGLPGDYSSEFGVDYLNTWTHFEPRIGLSYDPRGQGREVIRVSYGTFYDFELSQGTYLGFIQGPPYGDTIKLTTGKFANPWANYVGPTGIAGNPFPITGIEYPPASAYSTFLDLHNKAPMLQQWNVSVQKQFGSNWSITASYVGNHSTHILLSGDLNPGEYIPGTCGATACSTTANTQSRARLTMLNPTQGAFYSTSSLYQGDFGFAKYNGGILTVQKRMGNNFSMVANYTYSHCIDDGDGSSNAASARVPLNQAIGNCTWDHRHQLTVNGAIRSPEFHSGLLEASAGHWQLAPIFSYLSGDWLTVTTGTDIALTGDSANQRPNIVGNPKLAHTPLGGRTSGVHWFNPAAFAAPALASGFTGNVVNEGYGSITVGPLGDLSPQTINGPSNKDFDLALTREFKLNERNLIQARVEAFNVFNFVRFYDPTTVMNNQAFGESTAPTTIQYNLGYSTPQDPRIMQFALKYVF